MIPQFPQFKPLERTDRFAASAITNRFPPYSDFNFTSLWVWDMSGERALSILNDNLVVRFTDYTDQSPFLSFIGDCHVEETARSLLSHCAATGLPPALRLIPELSAASLLSLKTEEEPEHHDYVYSTLEWSHLQGRKSHRAKMLAQKFEREHYRAQYHGLDLRSPAVWEDISGLASLWANRKAGHTNSPEHAALDRLFALTSTEQFIASGVSIDDSLIAFSIDESVQDNFAICHFCKADVSYSGVYHFLNREKARMLVSKQIRFLNAEQDLGLETLRAAKKALRPVSYLKKFVVSASDEGARSGGAGA